ncbi:MAG: PAP2 family protein, partial [Bradyrhizobium sp.]
MVDSNACIAWRLFHLNWIPVAAMGGVLLLGVAQCGFSIEPVAFAIPIAIAVALGLTTYVYAFA